MPTIDDLINSVADQDFSAAGVTFNELMKEKMTSAINQEKVAVANSVFNEEDEDDDFSDEEIEDAINEVDDSEDDEDEDDEDEDDEDE